MPSERVATVKAIFEAFNSGRLERIVALVDPEFEAVVPPELSAEPDTYRGHEGIRRYFTTFVEAMEEIRFHPEEFREGKHAVIATVRMTARGKQTAIAVEQRFAQVWMLRDRRAWRVMTYPTLEQALDAAGVALDAPDPEDGGPAHSMGAV